MTIKSIFNNQNFNCESNDNCLVACGNSLEILKNIKDETIDLIFADPPYNIGKDFGNNVDKWNSIYEYITWCKTWIDECFRILKSEGTFYFMTATQHISYLDIYVSEKYNILSRLIWAYDSSGVQSKKMYGSLYEPIIMANKKGNTKYTFNSDNILVEAKTGAIRNLINYRKTPPQLYNTQKIPGNVWDISRVRFKMNEYENHPTQKPEELLRRIILASSNKEDIVLDPFAGSFTTCSVALKHNRRTIGIDLNNDYFEIGLRRTGITNFYNGKTLIKDKNRKTNNKSKKDH